MILCSECYDKGFDNNDFSEFVGVIPQSTCAKCGRLCLGYRINENTEEDEG